MKTNIMITAAIVCVIGIGCAGGSSSSDTPDAKVKKTLSTFLKAETRNDFQQSYALVSSSDRNVKSLDDYRKSMEANPLYAFMGVLAEHVSFGVDSVVITGSVATAIVAVTSPDLEKMGNFQLTAIHAVVYKNEEKIEELKKTLKAKLVAGEVPMLTHQETLRLVLEDGEWRMVQNWRPKKATAQQSAAPLPPAPQAGPPEGAR